MIDTIMYALYIFTGIVPFTFLRIYPFRDKMIVKQKYFWFIYSIIVIIEAIWFVAIEQNGTTLFVSDNELLRLMFYPVYFIISLIFIKEKPSKHLIVWSFCIIFCSTFTAFTFLIDTLFPSTIPFLTKNITIFLLLPFFMYFSFFFITKKIMPLINQSNTKTNQLISSLLLLIIVMELITIRELPANTLKPLSILGIRIVACAITVVVWYIFSAIIAEQKEIQRMIEENKQKEKMLDVSTQQFIALSDKIEEARRARHDLKFHISAIKTLATKKDYSSILDYLKNDYLIPNDDVLNYCNYPILNIILSYYRDIAKEHNIKFIANLYVSNELFLSNNEIWVLLGNLLENSIEASKHIPQENRMIKIKMKANETSLALTVDNRFNENLLKRSGETFMSTKENGGVGIKSVSFLSEKYNGLATFDIIHDWFLSSVTMYKQNNGIDEDRI